MCGGLARPKVFALFVHINMVSKLGEQLSSWGWVSLMYTHVLGLVWDKAVCGREALGDMIGIE